MDYRESLNYIHKTPKFARVLGNDMLKKLLFHLGDPQKNLKFIHIAGTNGKGSYAVMMAEILKNSGYKVGLYTSPYIERFNERIQINGEQISDEALAEAVTLVKQVIETNNAPVSEFALDTAIAFYYFNKYNCDIVVLETGLGGRIDATNVIDTSVLSVIMSIGYDHTQYLGSTIEEITYEKCGIIKPNGNVICYPDLDFKALSTVKSVCSKNNANLTIADKPIIFEDNSFSYNRKIYELKMCGEFQKYNAATVLCSIEKLVELGYNIPSGAVIKGLKNAFNPARFEKLNCGLYLDGAHNSSAAKQLCKSIITLQKNVHMCIAMMADKDIKGCIKEFAHLNPTVTVTEVNMPRCASADVLRAEFNKYGIDAKIIKDPVTAAKTMLAESGTDDFCIACGSLYLVGLLRKELKG